MRPAAQVQAAIELLSQSLTSQTPVDRLMAGYFRQRRYIGSKDKAVVSGYFYGVVRQRAQLEYLLTQNGLQISARHLMAAYLQLDESDIDLKQTFTGQRHQPRPLTSFDQIAKISPEQLQQAPEYVQLEVPKWLEPKLKHSLGEQYLAEMNALSARAPTDLRVNTLKADRVSVHDELLKQGIPCAPGKCSPWSLRLEQRAAINNLGSFKRGEIEVQDEGSQILALITGASPGETVIDFCAGAGGKSLAMAAMMNNKGTLYACDVHDKRLANLSKRARRAGVHNIRVKTLNSEQDKWVKQHEGMADLVLVDAPCSGTGTWRRNPDSRWNLMPDNLENLAELQASILANASRLVKPGGRLVYATCSLLTLENEDQRTRFLTEYPNFKARSFDSLPEQITQKQAGSVRLLTSLHATDGFYAAGFVKLKN